MKKSDLKTGMLIMLRDESIMLLVNETFICKKGGFDCLIQWSDDLTNPNEREFDVIKISKVLEGMALSFNEWTESLIDINLLWKEEMEIFACELDGITYSQSTLRSIIKKANSN